MTINAIKRDGTLGRAIADVSFPSDAYRRTPVASPIKATAPFQIELAVAVLVRAFRADPSVRWAFPDTQQYLIHFPPFVRMFGKAFECGTAQGVSDENGSCIGAALWLPPGVQPDEEALMRLLERSVSAQDQEEVFAVFEQMDRYHPREPHWYLPLIGVDPAQQRKGYGSALLEPALRICDRDRKLAYLESSNPANVSLYERHGFERLGTIQVGASPPVVPMVRTPR